MLGSLARVLREAREAAKVSQLTIAIQANSSQAVVSRLEGQERWPEIGPDRMVDAYAEECGVEWLELWERALRLARSTAATRLSEVPGVTPDCR
jgi:transcriptional regulator with XRE-family HTH domain